MEVSNSLVFNSDNELELSVRLENESVWLNRQQMSLLFDRDVKTIGKHIGNIFKEGELNKNSVVTNFATTATDGKTYQVEFYNLDAIISVGYRVKSLRGTQFRIWATKRLKEHLLQGYSIDKKRFLKNEEKFLKAVEELKSLSNFKIQSDEILSLIQTFAHTWITLDSYDKNEFPKSGDVKDIKIQAIELENDLQIFKKELMGKSEATELFAQEKTKGALRGIFGNVFQSVFGQDAYESVEEKAAHLLYFIVKNHPFNDGNKRSGAFSFIWLLSKFGFNFQDKISPQTLSSLTLLIAQSNPKDKDRLVGIVRLLLKES
ncbi:MAG: death-on-curing protein [Proteobacteria bacterium]|nr:MAG: death-on-curing protein [Pseudomonadota bacterium]